MVRPRPVRVRTYVFASLSVKFVQFFVQDPLSLEVFVSRVEHQSRACVLDRVVGIRLNVFVEHKPRKKPERKATLTLSQEVKVHRVYHSLRGDVDIYKQPIVSKRMPKVAKAH